MCHIHPGNCCRWWTGTWEPLFLVRRRKIPWTTSNLIGQRCWLRLSGPEWHCECWRTTFWIGFFWSGSEPWRRLRCFPARSGGPAPPRWCRRQRCHLASSYNSRKIRPNESLVHESSHLCTIFKTNQASALTTLTTRRTSQTVSRPPQLKPYRRRLCWSPAPGWQKPEEFLRNQVDKSTVAGKMCIIVGADWIKCKCADSIQEQRI